MPQGEKPAGANQVQAVPASLPRTCSAERLADFFSRVTSADQARPHLGYPADYFRWLATIPGRDRYMDAALIDQQRSIVGAVISRPLKLGMWSNVKLRAALREAASGGGRYGQEKGWVRYLSRERDRELTAALATVLPEEHHALKAAVIEFLELDPSLADQGYDRTLLDVILTEARAEEYDYILCWGNGTPLPACNSRAVAAEAVLEMLPEHDAGLLRVYNTARYGARATRLWVRAQRTAMDLAVRRAGSWLRRLAVRLRRPAGGPKRLKAGPERWRQETGGQPRPSGHGRPIPTDRKEEALTFDGIRVLCVGGPNLTMSDALVERLRSLMSDTQENYGIFPTYDAHQLRALLAPAHGNSRFASLYASRREARRLDASADPPHDVLSCVAVRGDDVLAFLFGHRLPWFGAHGWVEEAWLVRAVHFRRGLHVLTRADIVQRCADAVASLYGIRRVLVLRPAGLGEHCFSRLVLGSTRTADRLALYYVPLSERAMAEQAVLARRLPVGYV